MTSTCIGARSLWQLESTPILGVTPLFILYWWPEVCSGASLLLATVPQMSRCFDLKASLLPLYHSDGSLFVLLQSLAHAFMAFSWPFPSLFLFLSFLGVEQSTSWTCHRLPQAPRWCHFHASNSQNMSKASKPNINQRTYKKENKNCLVQSRNIPKDFHIVRCLGFDVRFVLSCKSSCKPSARMAFFSSASVYSTAVSNSPK